MKSKKQNQNCRAKTCCIVQDCRSFVDPCNFANNFNSYTFDVKIHAMSLWPLCCESEAILAKKLSQSPRLECSYGNIFTPIIEILGPLHIWAQSTELTRFPRSRLATLPFLKISLSVTGPAHASFLQEPIEIFMKERMARRGNRARLVDRSYIKRPLIVIFKVYGSFVSRPLSVYHRTKGSALSTLLCNPSSIRPSCF